MFLLHRIRKLEKKQARPLREIAHATLEGHEIPPCAKKRVLDLEFQIRHLRSLLTNK